MLPEARRVLSALATSLSAAIPASPAGALVALLKAAGVSQDDGALLPDGLAHLLHDPGTHVRTALATPGGRAALLDALHGLLPELTVTGDVLHAQLGPVTFDADLAAQTVGFTASGNDGVLSWHAGAAFDAAGNPTFEAGLGDPASDALALSVQSGPLSAQLLQRGVQPVALWPTPDVDGLAGSPPPRFPLRRSGSSWRVCAASTTSSAPRSRTSLPRWGCCAPRTPAASGRSRRRSSCSATPPPGCSRPACCPPWRAGRSTLPGSPTCSRRSSPSWAWPARPAGPGRSPTACRSQSPPPRPGPRSRSSVDATTWLAAMAGHRPSPPASRPA